MIGPVSGMSATRNWVPCHGMRGWLQEIQASLVPSGDGTGEAKKSAPVTRTRTADGLVAARPDRGTEAMARVTVVPSWLSRTQMRCLRSGESTKSA